LTNPKAQRKLETEIFFELAIIYCMLVSLGFPGNLTNVVGESMEKILEYGAFALELVLIMFSSSGAWQDIELLRLDKKYWVMYLFVFSCFGISMLVSYDKKAQFITCARLVVTMMFVIWLQERYSLFEILQMVCIAQGAFVLITIFFIIVFPGYGFSDEEGQAHALVGLYQTKNACGTELDFGIVMTVLLLHEKRKLNKRELKWWLLLIVQIVLLLMCRATGAIITVAFAVLSIYLFKPVRVPLGLMYITVNIVFLFCMLALMPLFEDMLVAMG